MSKREMTDLVEYLRDKIEEAAEQINEGDAGAALEALQTALQVENELTRAGAELVEE